MSEIDSPPPRPNRRILFRLFRGFLLFVVLLIVTYLIADQILLRKVQRQREAFKERFGAVDFRDFIPERPAPEIDSARLYALAIGLIARADREYGDWSMYHALTEGSESFRRWEPEDADLPGPEEIDEKVLEKMVGMDEAFRAIEKADALDRGAFLQSYEPEHMLPILAEVRMLARNIAAKAMFEARRGNLNAACASLESGLHLVNTMNEYPTLVVHLVRTACVGLVLDATEDVMNMTSEKLPLGDRYWLLVNQATNVEVYRNTLASEAAYGMAQKQKLPMPRLFWSTNESELIDFYLELDDISRIESPMERRKRLDAIPVEQNFPMSPLNWMVPMLAPSLVRSVDAFDRITAQCDFVRLAMALRAWKRERGSYPDSLGGIVISDQTSPPLDPFSGEAYQYRREGEGFVLYSVGPDRKDDGGTKIEDQKSGGDIVWTCVR